MTAPILDVRCGRSSDAAGGWLCLVKILDGPFSTEHRVTVAPAVLERLDPGAADAERLVRTAFAFLLEREAASSILRSFDITVIGRYFPGWEADVERRLRG